MRLFRIASLIITLFSLLAFDACSRNPVRWKLVWQDNFNSSSLDTTVWSVMKRRNDDSRRHHSGNLLCYDFRKGKLILRGIVNPDRSTDTARYLTGAVTTEGKKAFSPGRIEIRAKMKCAYGAWPALWLMPFKMVKGWPADGEIDIMEHLNHDDFVYQTVHSSYTKADRDAWPQRFTKVPVDVGKFNTYGVDILEDRIIFHVNGKETLCYPRAYNSESNGQYPYYHDWYLMLCMQLGGKWVGNIDSIQLPVEMEIDWVRQYCPL